MSGLRPLWVASGLLLLLSGPAAAEEESISTSSFMAMAPNLPMPARQLIGMEAVEVGGRPVACYGLVRLPDQQAMYTWLLIFNTPRAQKAGGIGTENKGSVTISEEEFRLDYSGKIRVGGRTVEIAYQFKADETQKALQGESLKLGGREITPLQTRVFLVDLRAEQVTFTPVKGEKLDLLPRQFAKGDYARGVLLTIEKLKQASPEVKKFLE